MRPFALRRLDPPHTSRQQLAGLLVTGALASCGGGSSPGTVTSQAGPPASASPSPTSPPGPATPTPTSPPARSTGAAVHLEDHGGICDGVTDNSRAIASALARAKELAEPVLVPVGTCAYGNVIRVDGVALTGTGEGSVLHALDWRRSAIFLSGDAPAVSSLKLTGAPAPSRQAALAMTRITVFGATGFVIDHVTIEGSSAAAIQTAQAPTRGSITSNVVRNTLADSIHVADGASFIAVENNLIENSGDDGIAVVSYISDPVRVNNITARNNVVRNNRSGRNMSVVGGNEVLYRNNLLQGNLAGFACLLVAQESNGASSTQGSDAVRLENNTVENCGSQRTGHGGVLIYSDGVQPNNNTVVADNDVKQSGQPGIKAYSNFNIDLKVLNNRVGGANPALNITSDGATVTPYTGGPVGYAGP